MFGRVPGTRPNISEFHSGISTRVPYCIAGGVDVLITVFYAATRLPRRVSAGLDKAGVEQVLCSQKREYKFYVWSRA